MIKRILLAVLIAGSFATAAFAQGNQCQSGSCVCPDATSPCKSGYTYGLSVTTTAQQLWPADGARKEIVIQSQPSNTGSICVAFGRTATIGPPSNCLVVAPPTVSGAPGGALILSNRGQANAWGQVNTQAVSIISLTGTNAITYYFSD